MIAKWVYPETGRPPKVHQFNYCIIIFPLELVIFLDIHIIFRQKNAGNSVLVPYLPLFGGHQRPIAGEKGYKKMKAIALEPWDLGVDKISKNWGWWWYVGGSKFHRWWLWDYDVTCSMFSIWYSRSYSGHFHFCLFLPVMFLPAALFSRALEASEVFNDLTQKRPANLSWIYSRLEGPVFVYRLFMTIYDYFIWCWWYHIISPPFRMFELCEPPDWFASSTAIPHESCHLRPFSGGWKSFAAVASQAVWGLGQPTGAVEPVVSGYPHNVACWSVPHLFWWLSQLSTSLSGKFQLAMFEYGRVYLFVTISDHF